MGVKTKLSLEDIKPFFSVEKLVPSTDGISDTVYILDDKYILKLFEFNTMETLNEELKLLNLCEDLPVAKIVKKPFLLKNKPALIYKKCMGKSLKSSNLFSIKQIANFLKQFHTLTKSKSSLNKNLYENKRLQTLIKQTKNKEFEELFLSLNLEFKNDGIIHGDLFIDNAVFIEEKLSCVFDFAEACNGDFIFDLAVVALSWCKDEEEYKLLLNTYGLDMDMEKFKSYIKYAMLYYSVTRYIEKKDYKTLLNRCKSI